MNSVYKIKNCFLALLVVLMASSLAGAVEISCLQSYELTAPAILDVKSDNYILKKNGEDFSGGSVVDGIFTGNFCKGDVITITPKLKTNSFVKTLTYSYAVPGTIKSRTINLLDSLPSTSLSGSAQWSFVTPSTNVDLDIEFDTKTKVTDPLELNVYDNEKNVYSGNELSNSSDVGTTTVLSSELNSGDYVFVSASPNESSVLDKVTADYKTASGSEASTALNVLYSNVKGYYFRIPGGTVFAPRVNVYYKKKPYTITKGESTGGTFTVTTENGLETAVQGEKVTIVATPIQNENEAYVLQRIFYTEDGGSRVQLLPNSDGKYIYTMKAANVKFEVFFYRLKTVKTNVLEGPGKGEVYLKSTPVWISSEGKKYYQSSVSWGYETAEGYYLGYAEKYGKGKEKPIILFDNDKDYSRVKGDNISFWLGDDDVFSYELRVAFRKIDYAITDKVTGSVGTCKISGLPESGTAQMDDEVRFKVVECGNGYGVQPRIDGVSLTYDKNSEEYVFTMPAKAIEIDGFGSYTLTLVDDVEGAFSKLLVDGEPLAADGSVGSGSEVSVSVAAVDGYEIGEIAYEYVSEGKSVETSIEYKCEVSTGSSVEMCSGKFIMPTAVTTIKVSRKKRRTITVLDDDKNTTITVYPTDHTKETALSSKSFSAVDDFDMETSAVVGNDIVIAGGFEKDADNVLFMNLFYFDEKAGHFAGKIEMTSSADGTSKMAYFTMPDADVKINVGRGRHIKIDPSVAAHCKYVGVPSAQAPSEKVIFTVSCDDGYHVTPNVKNAEGTDVKIEENDGTYIFAMETTDVTLSGEMSYAITLSDNISLTEAPSSAKEGEKVTVVVTDELGYEPVQNIYVFHKDASGSELPPSSVAKNEKGEFEFEMPAYPISVYVPRMKKEYTVSSEGTTSTCSIIDLASTLTFGSVGTFTVNCSEKYKLSMVCADKDVECGVISKADGEYSFAQPASNVTVKMEVGVDTYTIAMDRDDDASEFYVLEDAEAEPETRSYAKVGEIVGLQLRVLKGNILSASYEAEGLKNPIAISLDGLEEDAGFVFQEFIMPAANVKINVMHKKVEYALSVDNGDGHCKATGLNEKAPYQSKVSFGVACDEGYSATVGLTCSDAKECTTVAKDASGYSFAQPASNVTVKVSAEKKPETTPAKSYKIAAATVKNGKVTVDGTMTAGESVTFKIVPNDGYELDAITITKTGDSKITVTYKTVSSAKGSYKFTMPEYDVTITASFKAAKSDEGGNGKTDEDSKDDKSTAIAAVSSVPLFNVALAGRTLLISGVRAGSEVSVFTMQGRVVKAGRVNASNFEMALPYAGSYMVKVGNSAKVVNAR